MLRSWLWDCLAASPRAPWRSRSASPPRSISRRSALAPGQAPKTIYLGDEIIHNQKITTDAKGLLQILLADGTSFTVGPNSSLTINSFVYDPDAGTAKVVAEPRHRRLPLHRRQVLEVARRRDAQHARRHGRHPRRHQQSRFLGRHAYHVDMVYGDGVTLKDGTRSSATSITVGYSIVIGTDGKASS